MAYISRANGSIEQIDPKTLTEERIRKIVGGYIESALLEGNLMLLCDEEGKLKNKPVNFHASGLYGTDRHGVFIVGDVIIMTRKEGRKWR